MYKRISSDNIIFKSDDFLKDKYKFYIALKILSSEQPLVYSDEENYAILQGHTEAPIWIWTKDDINQNYTSEIFECIRNFYNTKVKMTCKKEFYDSIVNNKEIHLDDTHFFEMGSLYCNKTKQPKIIAGSMIKATERDVETLVDYWQKDNLEMHDTVIAKEQALNDVKAMIDEGNTYLLKDENKKIVCMASYNVIDNVAKINHVYTPIEERKKCYCANLIYNISNLLLSNGIVPMLYTDYNYIPSNKSYMNVGYIKIGTLITFKLKEEE